MGKIRYLFNYFLSWPNDVCRKLSDRKGREWEERNDMVVYQWRRYTREAEARIRGNCCPLGGTQRPGRFSNPMLSGWLLGFLEIPPCLPQMKDSLSLSLSFLQSHLEESRLTSLELQLFITLKADSDNACPSSSLVVPVVVHCLSWCVSL